MFNIFLTALYYIGMFTFAIGLIYKFAVAFDKTEEYYMSKKEMEEENSILAKYYRVINNS